MILVLNSQNKRKYADLLLQHHYNCHCAYADEHKWTQLARSSGRNRFDNDHAVYILALEDKKVIGGSRLIPTLTPHVLSEIFPNLAKTRCLPRAREVYEWTQVHVVKERQERSNGNAVTGSLLCGVLEFCLAQNITSLTTLAEMWRIPQFHEMGWEVSPLSLPELVGGRWLVAVQLPVQRKILFSIREFFQLSASPLSMLGSLPARQQFTFS